MVPKIDVDSKYPSILFRAYKDICKYYPIGLPIDNSMYDDYHTLRKIIAEKTDRTSNNNLPNNITNLIYELQNKFDTNHVVNEFIPFPSYSVSINLNERKENELHYTCRLKVKISLIGKYYTFFYENDYITLHLLDVLAQKFSMRHSVLSGTNNFEDPFGQYYNIVKELIKYFFSEYEFISHVLLFKYPIIGGQPHGTFYDISLKQYFFYDFLFDNNYQSTELVPGHKTVSISI